VGVPSYVPSAPADTPAEYYFVIITAEDAADHEAPADQLHSVQVGRKGLQAAMSLLLEHFLPGVPCCRGTTRLPHILVDARAPRRVRWWRASADCAALPSASGPHITSHDFFV